MDNYNIGFNAGYNYRKNNYIAYNVRKNDPVLITRYNGVNRDGQPFTAYNIIHNGICVGQLAKSSSIARQMTEGNIDCLTGFFVSDVFYWTYQDTLDADKRKMQEYQKNPAKFRYVKPVPFAPKWCEETKKMGFVFIVDIAGYGKQK